MWGNSFQWLYTCQRGGIAKYFHSIPSTEKSVFLSVCHHFKNSGNLAFCFWGGPYGKNMINNVFAIWRKYDQRCMSPKPECQISSSLWPSHWHTIPKKTATPSLIRCLSFAPSAKFQLLSVRSPWGASVSSPSLTSDTIHKICPSFKHEILFQGSITTSSMRTASPCTLDWGLQSSITIPAFPPGCGMTERTLRVWQSASPRKPLFF